MVTTHQVLIVLLAECAAIIAGLGLLIGHGVWLAVRERRMRPRRAAAQAAIVSGLVERPDEALPLSVLDGLSRSERQRVLGHHSPGITGRQRDTLLDLASRAGVLSRAERGCRSRRWRRRLQGVRIYTLLGGGQHIVPHLFGDHRAEVRAEAATWAAEHPESEIVSQLVSLLGDGATLCRFTVKDSLLRLGSAVVQPLHEHLTRATGAAAASGLEVAAALGDPRLLDVGFRLADSPDDGVRRRAVELLGALGGDRSVQTLIAHLQDPAAEVRAASARALGAGHHRGAVGSVAACLRDPSWQVRHEAGVALRRSGAPGELLLRRMLTDEDRFARDMAQLMLDLPFAPA